MSSDQTWMMIGSSELPLSVESAAGVVSEAAGVCVSVLGVLPAHAVRPNSRSTARARARYTDNGRQSNRGYRIQWEATMNSILYVGMDVYKENYTLCCYSFDRDKVEYRQTVPSDYRLILKYLEQVHGKYLEEVEFICGYEAGCLGYSLYHQLTDHGVKCIILAPTTMGITNTNRVKTDRKDAANIARCLAFHTYSAVYVPDGEDNAVKEYLRMRDDQKLALKKIKQQITAFVLRLGKQYTGSKSLWTENHLKWLRGLDLTLLEKETLQEYLITYDYLTDKLERLDARIEELARNERYGERVRRLGCFIGIKPHTALSLLVEVGDFRRFEKAPNFAGFLGLVPGEDIEIKYTGLRPGEKLYEELLATKENTLPTENEKIYRAQVREYDYEDICTVMSPLIDLAIKVDKMGTVRMMKGIVPEFKSKNSVYEVLDKE